MFTGIIENTSDILSIDKGRFTLKNIFGNELKNGQSIAHDGACMTVESFNEKSYSFFAMQESLEKTNLGSKKVGESCNIERCMQVNTRVDGHFVSGHIDTTGNISVLEKREDTSLIIGVDFPVEFSKYTIQKGSIAINGVSLTIVDKRHGYISVSLIPLTQDWTNLGGLELGAKVNLEFDMLGKYVLNMQNDS